MKKRGLISVAAAAALAAASLVAVAPASNAAAKTITLAFQGPLTGEQATVGQDELAGMRYAIKVWSAKKENKGKYKIKVVLADDQGDPAQAAKVAPGIASNKNIIGLVGAAYSGATIASLPFYKQRNLPMISPSATRVSITDPAAGNIGFPVFHRVVARDDLQGPALFKLATKGVSSPKVFVVDDQSAYGIGLVAYMKPSIPAAQLAGFDSVPSATTDWSATISKVRSQGANVVIYTGYYPQAAPFFKQLRDSGYTGILAGGDGVLSPSFPSLAPASVLNGVRITAGTLPLVDIDPKLEADFVKRMGKPSGVYVELSIDATNVFLSCITKGVSTRDAMLKCVKSFKGKSVTGATFSFDQYGDVSGGGINGFEVKDGKNILTGPVK